MTERELQRILLVDDDEDIRMVGAIGLRRVGGFEVEVCSCGNEALGVVGVVKPDLVLLDVMMPGMDGPTTLKELKKRPEWEDLEVVFITAKTQPQEQAEYLRLGALGVIKKPFDPMTVSEQIRGIWEKRRRKEDSEREGSEGLKELRERYESRLGERMGRIQGLLLSAREKGSRENLKEARREVHKLAGSGLMFGFPEVSEICKAGDALLLELVRSEGRLPAGKMEELQGFCRELQRLLDSLGLSPQTPSERG